MHVIKVEGGYVGEVDNVPLERVPITPDLGKAHVFNDEADQEGSHGLLLSEEDIFLELAVLLGGVAIPVRLCVDCGTLHTLAERRVCSQVRAFGL